MTAPRCGRYRELAAGLGGVSGVLPAAGGGRSSTPRPGGRIRTGGPADRPADDPAARRRPRQPGHRQRQLTQTRPPALATVTDCGCRRHPLPLRLQTARTEPLPGLGADRRQHDRGDTGRCVRGIHRVSCNCWEVGYLHCLLLFFLSIERTGINAVTLMDIIISNGAGFVTTA